MIFRLLALSMMLSSLSACVSAAKRKNLEKAYSAQIGSCMKYRRLTEAKCRARWNCTPRMSKANCAKRIKKTRQAPGKSVINQTKGIGF